MRTRAKRKRLGRRLLEQVCLELWRRERDDAAALDNTVLKVEAKLAGIRLAAR